MQIPAGDRNRHGPDPAAGGMDRPGVIAACHQRFGLASDLLLLCGLEGQPVELLIIHSVAVHKAYRRAFSQQANPLPRRDIYNIGCCCRLTDDRKIRSNWYGIWCTSAFCCEKEWKLCKSSKLLITSLHK